MNDHKKNTFGKRFLSRVEKILGKSNLAESEFENIEQLIDKAESIQSDLEIKNHALNERSKELKCLYNISRIIEKSKITSDELINEVISLIPPAFQYPEFTCVQITYNHKDFKTPKFNVTPWKLAAGIYIKRKKKGIIEVYYLKEMPTEDEGPFLEEEKSLLFTVARQIGHFIEQKETEKALRAEQKRLISAQRIARMGDFSWNIKTGSVFWSDAMFDLLGYDRHEVFDYARVNNDIHHPDDLNWVTNWLQRCLESGKVEHEPMEYRLIRKDGKIITVQTHVSVKYENGNAVELFGTVQDITKRIKAESELNKSEEILRIASNSMNGILYAFDKDLNVTLSKGKKLSVLGLTPDEMVGKSVFDFYNTTDRNHPGIKKHFQGLEGKGIQYETVIGEYVFSNIISPIKNSNNEIVGGVGIATDITQLRNTEKKQRMTQFAVDKSQIGIYQVGEDGTITYVNEFACKNLGYSSEELIGKNILDIDSSYTPESFREHRSITRNLGKRKIITTHKHKNGRLIPVEVTVNYFELFGEKFTFSFVNDISERIEAEDVLKASEERYRAVFENTGTATCIIAEDGTILLANEKFAELAGFSLDDIINRKKWMEFVFEADLDRMLKQHKLRRIDKEQALNEYDFRFVGRDKQLKYIHLEVDLIPGTDKSVASLLDITQQIENAKAIKERERQLFTLMNNLPGMAYRCKNDKYWTMEFVSSGSEKLTGYKAEELVDNTKLSYGEMIHEEDWKKVWDAVQETQLNDESFVVEYRIRDKYGKLHWVWEQGKIVEKHIDGRGFLEGFIMDITERKEAEQELQKLKNELQNQVDNKTKELSERIKELESFYEKSVEKESTIKELKEEINRLKQQH